MRALIVLAAPGPKRVHIRMLRDVNANDFGAALSDGLKENHTPRPR